MNKKFSFKKTLSLMLVGALGFTMYGCSQNAKTSSTVTTPSATTEAWKPTRPVTIVCFVGAGGGTDLASRTIAKVFEKHFGVPFQVVNVVGGSGGVGANKVLSSKLDGYTILGSSEPLNGLAELGSMPKPASQLWDTMMLMGSEGAISVPEASPYKTIEELIEAAKTKSIKVAAAQATSTWSAKLHQVEKVTGVKFNQLPYEGSNPSNIAALSGEVDVVITSLAEQADYIKTKKLRPLAAISKVDEEVPGYGKVPSLAKAYPKYNDIVPAMQWLGISMPNAMPDNIKKAYHDAFTAAVTSEEVKKVASDMGYKIYGLQGDKSVETQKNLDAIYSWTLFDAKAATISPDTIGIPRP